MIAYVLIGLVMAWLAIEMLYQAIPKAIRPPKATEPEATEVLFLVVIVAGEYYVFHGDDTEANRRAAVNVATRFASNPELNFRPTHAAALADGLRVNVECRSQFERDMI